MAKFGLRKCINVGILWFSWAANFFPARVSDLKVSSFSDSSSNSHLGSEADDEGEESWESGSPTKDVAPWHENDNDVDNDDDDVMDDGENGANDNDEMRAKTLDLSLVNTRNRPDLKARLNHYATHNDVSRNFFCLFQGLK